MANVRVVCRLRPMSDREKKMGTVPAASASTERKEVTVVRKTSGGRPSRATFRFDEVLSSFSSQEDVFAATLRPLVDQVLEGYEATAFAYGQTGTGKTYTIEGATGSEDQRGLLPRAAAAVLEALARDDLMEHAVTISYLEIYNEELCDLLAPADRQQKLDLMESGDSRGVCCVGLSEVTVASLEDILGNVATAQERRRVAETRINARSSRSHCIFTMKVFSRKACEGGERETIGKLHLVDLAGSECAKKATAPCSSAAHGADEQALASAAGPRAMQPVGGSVEQERERRNINQSLLTLRRVITALREKSGRIPYRDSKLTRLLKDALGGSTRTVVIATISPALTVVEETLSTLAYAEQASGIQNRPVASSLLRMGSASSDRLGSGDSTPVGFGDLTSDIEMRIAYMAQEVEEAQGALARKQQESQELAERAEAAEQELAETKDELRRAHEALAASEAAREAMAASARGLAAQLDGGGNMAAMREKIARRVAELGERAAPAAEQQILALVRAQREALEREGAGTRKALEEAYAELATARAATAALRDSQARGRSQALEAIVEFARRELADLGDMVDGSAEEVDSHLGRAEAFAGIASAAASSAEECGLEGGVQVGAAAQRWAHDVAARCNAVAKLSGDAAVDVERKMATIAARLWNLGQTDSDAGLGKAGAEPQCVAAVSASPDNCSNAEPWDHREAKENRDVIDVRAAAAKALGAERLEAAETVVTPRFLPQGFITPEKAVTVETPRPGKLGHAAREPLREVN